MTQTSKPPWRRALAAVLETAGLTLAIVALFCGTVLAWYYAGWTSSTDWREAWRHGSQPRMLLDRFVYLRWIHPDAQYWLAHVDFSDGPVTVRGRPPDAPYWSLTWYRSPATNDSLNDLTVVYEDDWTYTIDFGPEKGDAPNWIEVEEHVGKALLYLRVYDPRYTHPTWLPEVRQGDRLLAPGGPR